MSNESDIEHIEAICDLIEGLDPTDSDALVEWAGETMAEVLDRIFAVAYMSGRDPARIAQELIVDTLVEMDIQAQMVNNFNPDVKMPRWRDYRRHIANRLAERSGSE